MNEELQQYLEEIEKYPELSRAEEKALAKEIEGGEKAKNKLVQGNMKLVVEVARVHHELNPEYSLMEIIREGNLGLMKAAQNYDTETSEHEFAKYARWWVKQAILRFFNSKNM